MIKAKSTVFINPSKVKLTVDLPLSVDLLRKTKKDKRIHLTLNVINNTHHVIYNQAKKKFTELLLPILEEKRVKIKTPVLLVFTIYKNRKSVCDVGNYCVVEKFASDALVKAEILPDDNFNHIQGIMYFWGGFADENKAVLEIVEL